MSKEKERLEVAQWILERNLAWIAAAEVKVGVIVAIDVAMLGGLGAAVSAEGAARTTWAYVFGFLAAAALALGLICSAMAVLPRIQGPKKSFLFFGCIKTQKSADYVDQFAKADDSDLLADLAAQIHRNAEIASDKFNWVKKSMWFSFLSMVPWFGAIIVLMKV